MRYYDIRLTNNEGAVIRRWSTLKNDGSWNPAALNVDFDVSVAPYDTPVGAQALTIEGVSKEDISQAQQFAGLTITMSAGMSNGLPIATKQAKNSGVIFVGQIFQSFGNWQGTEMLLSFIIMPSTYTLNNPGNIVFSWNQGQDFKDAIRNCLSVAYPNYLINTDPIPSGEIVAAKSDFGYYPTIEALAAHFANNFPALGIKMQIQSGVITIYMTEVPLPANTLGISRDLNTVTIDYLDMIGQPVWIAPYQLQFKVAIRADVKLGGYVQLPNTAINVPGSIATTGASLPSSLKYYPTFTGGFQIIEVRHIGSLRASNPDSWVTIITGVQNG